MLEIEQTIQAGVPNLVVSGKNLLRQVMSI